MEIRHKKTNQIHYISQEDWLRIIELKMDSSYKVIANDNISEPIDIKIIREPIIEEISLKEDLITAIYNDDFDSKDYTVKQINDFLRDNPDKVKHFEKDKRTSIKR